MPRPRWFAAAAVIAALAAIITVAVHYRAEPRRPRPPARVAAPLNVERIHALMAERRVAAQRLPGPTAAPARTTPTRLSAEFLRKMIRPRCNLGPADLCALVAGSVDACADGDADTCLAVAQYLRATPPYPMATAFFQDEACRLGNAAACAPNAITYDGPVDCAREPLVCASRARHAHDLIGLDQGCTRGVADACAVLALEFHDERATSRAYLTAACEAGGVYACAALAQRLAPTCDEDCYTADPAQARLAASIACDAGDLEACRLAAL